MIHLCRRKIPQAHIAEAGTAGAAAIQQTDAGAFDEVRTQRRGEFVGINARLSHVRLPTTAATNGECHFPNNEVGAQSAIPGIIGGDGE